MARQGEEDAGEVAAIWLEFTKSLSSQFARIVCLRAFTIFAHEFQESSYGYQDRDSAGAVGQKKKQGAKDRSLENRESGEGKGKTLLQGRWDAG